MELEAIQLEFMGGGTKVQCVKSDNRVTPPETRAEASCKKEEKQRTNNRSVSVILIERKGNREENKMTQRLQLAKEQNKKHSPAYGIPENQVIEVNDQ